jgi:hypothetical protein
VMPKDQLGLSGTEGVMPKDQLGFLRNEGGDAKGPIRVIGD